MSNSSTLPNHNNGRRNSALLFREYLTSPSSPSDSQQQQQQQQQEQEKQQEKQKQQELDIIQQNHSIIKNQNEENEVLN